MGFIRSKKDALAEAVERWGRGAGVRFNRDAAVGPDRARLIEEMRAHNATKPATRTGPEWKAWRKTADGFLAAVHHHRCEVGVVFMGIAFEIKGGGDTWDEAFTVAVNK